MRGLHGKAERYRHGVTVYLVPGLTAGQRRAVIRRLRQEASRGVGPALPLPQLAAALILDRVRSAARTAGAVVRLHPAVTLLPGAVAVALMTLFVVASAGRPVLVTGQEIRLAEAAVDPVGPQAVTMAVVPARSGGLTSAVDASAGLAAGRRTTVGHATVGHALHVVRRRRRAVSYRLRDAWWDCSAAVIGTGAEPIFGQLTCGRRASWLAPYTAQLPDPRAFAA